MHHSLAGHGARALMLRVASDAVIALCLYSIAVLPLCRVRQRPDAPFGRLIRLYSALLLFCTAAYLFQQGWVLAPGQEALLKAGVAVLLLVVLLAVSRSLRSAFTGVDRAHVELSMQLQESYTVAAAKAEELAHRLEEANRQMGEEISARKRLQNMVEEKEIRLENALSAAEAANTAKNKFVASLSHEVRTPMNAIIGLSHVLSRSNPLTPRQRECVDVLHASAEGLMEMLTNLFDFSYLDVPNPANDSSASPTTPAALAEEASKPAAKAKPARKPAKQSVLVVEDWQPNVMVISMVLEHLGYEHEVALSGEQALRLFEEKSYAAILMDIHMPGLDGYETTRQIRAREVEESLARTPIIATTAFAMKTDRDKCLAAGMDEYITKPINIEELSAKLAQAVK